MRFFFDARYIRVDVHDGISRFSASLATAVHAIAGDETTFLVRDPAQLRLLPAGARWLRIHPPTSVLEPFSALVLNRYRPDVVFSPMQMMGTLGRRFRAILTVHDLIYYRHRTPPEGFGALLRLGWRLFHLSYWPERFLLDAADAIATVSRTTQREIGRVRLTRKPTFLVPNAPQRVHASGSQTRFLERVPFDERPPRNLVYMGSFMPYKNVELLVASMRRLPEHTLHLLSPIPAHRRRELAALVGTESLGAGRVVFHDGVTDAEYARLLGDRGALVTASLDEGYGLPVAEALALGVPAVVSDLAIFHEVAGEGARYFDPRDGDAFVREVRALDDVALRRRLVESGVEHVGRFSWRRSAQALVDRARGLCSSAGPAAPEPERELR